MTAIPSTTIPAIDRFSETEKSDQDLALIEAWTIISSLFKMKLSTKPNHIRSWLHTNQKTLQEIRALNLSQLNLQTLPKELGLFSSLEILILSDCNLSKLDYYLLTNFNHLKELHLVDNRIENLADLPPLPQLERLSLVNNELTNLEHLPICPHLTFLDVSNNQLTTLSNLPLLPKLYTLIANNNQLKTVDLQQVGSLNLLEVKGNPLRLVNSSMSNYLEEGLEIIYDL